MAADKDDKKAKKDELKAPGKDGDAAPDANAENAGEEGGKRFNAKKIVLLVLFPLVLLGGSGTGAYYMGYLDSFLGKTPDCENVVEGDEAYEACAGQHAAAASNMTPGTFIEIPDMIVNLNSTSRQPRFLKISLKIELEKAEDQKGFETVLPRVVDQFQTYLRELRIEDLRGSSGMYRMKIELLSRVKAAAPEIAVRDVLFQEILVQ
jgi:flagellar FliL protein